jgi:2,3-bisphosphoglycerate-dependent phosphoglycerate mutase
MRPGERFAYIRRRIMNTVLYAVRHGETEWNSVEKQQGHLNSPLTENGIRQAQLLADGLAKRNIDVLFSSDLGRALQTAEIIAKRLSLDIYTDARLRERHLGIMQSLTRKEFEERYPAEALKFNSNDPDYVLPGGESSRQLFNRCIACAEEIAGNNAGKGILIVGHGGVLKSFFHKATNTPLAEPRRYSLFNASINSFSISNGQWRLDTWGEIAHLQDMKALDDN